MRAIRGGRTSLLISHRLGTIRDADLIEARMDGRTAFVTVKFISEQINVTRDSA